MSCNHRQSESGEYTLRTVSGCVYCYGCKQVWRPEQPEEKPETQISGDPVRPGYNHIQSKPKSKCACLEGFPHVCKDGEALMSVPFSCPCDCHGPKKCCLPGGDYCDLECVCDCHKPSTELREEKCPKCEAPLLTDGVWNGQCPKCFYKPFPQRQEESYTKEEVDAAITDAKIKTKRVMWDEEKEWRKALLDYLELPNLGNRGEHLSYGELTAKQYALRKFL